MIRTGTTTVGALTIAYRETGAEAASPVILLHGMGSKASTWDAFAEALADAGRRAIALDARGHGGSSPAPEYSFDLMVADLLGFLDEHRFDRVDLVGHSMGGGVAQLFAGRHPDRVRRLLIEEAAPPPQTPLVPPPDPPVEPPDPVDFDWRLVRPLLRQLRTPDPAWWDLLPSVAAPVLVLAGGPSSQVSQDRILAAADAMPDVRVVTIDCGHRIHQAAPAAFADAALDFLT